MKVLRAIGSFFARIGRWIRDTAWVQPLLIVGGIFAVIFSIPYITSWVGSWFEEGNEAQEYYEKYQLSLENCDEKESEADDIFEYILNIEKGEPNKDPNHARKYGEKFFLAFVQEDCSGCEAGYPGFKTLQDNWNKSGYTINDGKEFKLHTIFIDETDDNIEDVDNLFEKYFLTDNYPEVFETASSIAQDSAYCTSQGPKNSTNTYYTTATNLMEDFKTPTTFLIDTTGILEVIFDYEGADGSNTKFNKAETLRDAWNTEGDFSWENEDK